MNKKVFVLCLVGVASLMLALPIFAEKKSDTSAKQNSNAQQIRAKIEEKKKELNGSEWKVILKSSDGKEKEREDAFTFQNGQVRSHMLQEKSFVPTNYTITLPEGDSWTIWETMQTSSGSKEGVIFIRGEWKGDQMRGVMSQQMAEGNTKDYNFTTAGKTAVPATTAKEEPKKEAAAEPVKEAIQAVQTESSNGAESAQSTIDTVVQETSDQVEPVAATVAEKAKETSKKSSNFAKK